MTSTLFSFRYILYDINPGEGFNLRRDVFVRIAVMVKKMNENSSKFSYTLVLPPWGPLYHWQTRSLGDQTKIPWKNFFDVESISRYVPCLDFEDYLKSKFPWYYFTLKEESKITDENDIDLLIHTFWVSHKIWQNHPLCFEGDFVKFLWPSQNIWTLVKSPHFCESL